MSPVSHVSGLYRSFFSVKCPLSLSNPPPPIVELLWVIFYSVDPLTPVKTLVFVTDNDGQKGSTYKYYFPTHVRTHRALLFVDRKMSWGRKVQGGQKLLWISTDTFARWINDVRRTLTGLTRISTLLEKFSGFSLYLTDNAIAKLYVT